MVATTNSGHEMELRLIEPVFKKEEIRKRPIRDIGAPQKTGKYGYSGLRVRAF